MKMVVWTRAHRPFSFGGVNSPVGVEVEVGERLDLGKGFYGYVIVSPVTGDVHVAESTTGAFVGASLQQVRQHIKECDDVEVMRKQVADAEQMRKRVDVLPAEEFWSLFREHSE